MNDDIDKELDIIRKRKLEELKMSATDAPVENWPDKPIDITDVDFTDFIKKYPYVVVDCWAPWCGPCRMVSPVLEEIARDYAGKITVGKLNVDENQRVAMEYKIMSIPAMLIFKNGKFIDQVIGAMPRQMLEPRLKEYL
ncbi:MAG: thioredoxin [Thermoplasmata archaeon]|nr:thioredoxin [Thermoplasmata archaeon]